MSLSWYAAWIVAYLGYTSKYGVYWSFGFSFLSVAAVIAVLLVPLGVFKLHKILLDSDWEGTIVDIKFRYYDLSQNGLSLEARFDREKIILMAETTKGKLKEVVFLNDLLLSADYYKKGDRVRHYKWLNYYEKLDKSNDNTVICLNCARINGIDRKTCMFCGLDLQK